MFCGPAFPQLLQIRPCLLPKDQSKRAGFFASTGSEMSLMHSPSQPTNNELLQKLTQTMSYISAGLRLWRPWFTRKNEDPKIQLGARGSAVSYPAGSGAEPQPRSNLVYYSLKI